MISKRMVEQGNESRHTLSLDEGEALQQQGWVLALAQPLVLAVAVALALALAMVGKRLGVWVALEQ